MVLLLVWRQQGDRIIIIAYATYDPAELEDHNPKVLILNEKNEVTGEY